jgi:hypothetical protein
METPRGKNRSGLQLFGATRSVPSAVCYLLF